MAMAKLNLGEMTHLTFFAGRRAELQMQLLQQVATSIKEFHSLQSMKMYTWFLMAKGRAVPQFPCRLHVFDGLQQHTSSVLAAYF